MDRVNYSQAFLDPGKITMASGATAGCGCAGKAPPAVAPLTMGYGSMQTGVNAPYSNPQIYQAPLPQYTASPQIKVTPHIANTPQFRNATTPMPSMIDM